MTYTIQQSDVYIQHLNNLQVLSISQPEWKRVYIIKKYSIEYVGSDVALGHSICVSSEYCQSAQQGDAPGEAES